MTCCAASALAPSSADQESVLDRWHIAGRERETQDEEASRFCGAWRRCSCAATPQLAPAAPQRGGELVFGRYADSLFLDPVLNDANVDIWILTNLYDTLLQPTADGKSVEPGLATAWKVSDDGTKVTLTLREGVKFADGIAAHGPGREVVAGSGARPQERHLELAGRLDRQHRCLGLDRHPQAQAPRPLDRAGARHLQHGDPAGEAFHGRAGRHRRRQGQELCRASHRHRPVRAQELAARRHDGAGEEPELLGQGRGRPTRCPISTASSSRSSRTMPPGS